MTAEPISQPAIPGDMAYLFVGNGYTDETGSAWIGEALCAQTDPEAFFPEKGGSTRQAKQVCSGCTVRAECLDYALTHEQCFGIWGGLSERERKRFKTSAARQAAGGNEDPVLGSRPNSRPDPRVVQLPVQPVYDKTVSVRHIQPQLPELTGDGRQLVLNCLSLVAGHGDQVINFRPLMRKLGFSAEQQFLRFLRLQERWGFLECQMTSVSASSIRITAAGHQYLSDNRFGPNDQEGSEAVKDSKRFPAIKAYVEALPDQVLVVSGAARNVGHDLLKAAKVDNIIELRRVLRKLGREVLDAELTEDPDDGSLMLAFGPAAAAVDPDEAPDDFVPAVQAEVDETEADVAADDKPEAVPAGEPTTAASVPRQREPEPSQSSTRALVILRWFADLGGEVRTPGPMLAEHLGVGLMTARHDLQTLRQQNGFLGSRGKTRNTVYFLTAAGWQQLGLEPVAPAAAHEPAESAETVVEAGQPPVQDVREESQLPELAAECGQNEPEPSASSLTAVTALTGRPSKGVQRTIALLQALIARGGRWNDATSAKLNQVLPPELRFDTTSEMNVLIRQRTEQGLLSQSIDTIRRWREWIEVTDAGRDWLLWQTGQVPASGTVVLPEAPEITVAKPAGRQLQALRWLAAQPQPVQTPGPKLAEALGITLGHARTIIKSLRRSGWAEAAGETITRRYWLTEEGRRLAGQSPSQAAPVAAVTAEPSHDGLQVGYAFSLPIDAIVKRFAILGTSGSGKTSTAVVAENEAQENLPEMGSQEVSVPSATTVSYPSDPIPADVPQTKPNVQPMAHNDYLEAELPRVKEELAEAKVANLTARAENQILRERVAVLERNLAAAADTAAVQRRVVQVLLDHLPPSASDKVILSVVGAD